jgi:hypothetical protein
MIIKLTTIENEPILIGTESIIDIKNTAINYPDSKVKVVCAKIQSRGAMVQTNYVKETVEVIFDIINNQNKTA